MQETEINEGSFEFCPFISNNFQIIAQNSETGYGVCSLVHKKFTTENVFLHPSGRIIAFDIGPLTLINVYLPSGSDLSAKNSRENICGQTLPNMLLQRSKQGIVGGDWNCLTNPIDCTNPTEAKMSGNLKRLISLNKWLDSFRALNPNEIKYSHFYNSDRSGKARTTGASRLDRSYVWGGVPVRRSEYTAASFSDHFLHLIEVQCPEAQGEQEILHKPYFKISPDIAKDEDFKTKVEEVTNAWLKAKEKMPLLLWWDMLKKDVKNAAKQIKLKRARDQKSRLNYLLLAQIHLSKKVSEGNLEFLAKLKSIQLQINSWFDNEAEKVKLHARLQDIQESEKVRIYHHEQLYRTINKSTILKLKTPDGIISGHKDCAALLNKESMDLLGTEALLDATAQNHLLDSVTAVFTEKDNAMLEAEITDEEIKESLSKSNKNAAPGGDGLTFQTYVQCWSSLGPHLCQVIREVVKTGTPSVSMLHSFQVFSPKIGKSSSLLPKDKRRLALLQSDYKVLTGVLAARLRKTEDHTLSEHQYASSHKSITHAISQARDAIHNVSPSQKGCAIIQTDFQQAFDFLSVSWTWKVLERKHCSPEFIRVLRDLYELSPNYVINIINNEQQARILNKRKNIKQGDRTSTLLFCFAMEPLLLHLNQQLDGLVYHKLHTSGPKHPKLGPPPPVEARLKVFGFVDDVKGVVTSIKEFKLLDHTLKLFEQATGSKLHRDPTTKKCSIMTLGKWTNWKQNDSPLDYMGIVEELNFLGVLLARNSTKTRALNGEELTKKVRATIGGYKAGRHSPLICRPYTVNTYIMSKIVYRSAIINLRAQDINHIQSSIKQWVSQNLLLKPSAVLLYREVEQGGLGLLHTGARCMANLIKTFIHQAHPNAKHFNLYLNTLFRCFVVNELEEGKIKRPPYYSLEFFEIIKEAMHESHEHILFITTKGWQSRIMERGITHIKDPETGLPELILTEQEKQLKEADWSHAWILRRKQGLTPDQKSWLFKWSNGLLINNVLLHKIGKIPSDKCDFCEKQDTRSHILYCESTKSINEGIIRVIQTCTENKSSTSDIEILDLNVPASLQLPLLFIFSETLQQVHEARQKKQKLPIMKLTATVRAKSEAFLLSKKASFAHEVVKLWLETFFTPNLAQ